jgi:hypothetical protein
MPLQGQIERSRPVAPYIAPLRLYRLGQLRKRYVANLLGMSKIFRRPDTVSFSAYIKAAQPDATHINELAQVRQIVSLSLFLRQLRRIIFATGFSSSFRPLLGTCLD